MCNRSVYFYNKGFEKGYKEGYRIGVEMAIAKKMLLAGVSEDIIISCTGLPKDKVEWLKEDKEANNQI